MSEKSILQILRKEEADRIPIWFMRQAGRYLPEYKTIRTQCENFMDAVLTPTIAAEITLQPIKRFDLDAAIVFSDILVLPFAMNVPVNFYEGIGPVLEFDLNESILLTPQDEKFQKIIEKICVTVRLTCEHLKKYHPNVAMIGFAGAPWTVACYMLEKNRKKGGEFESARQIAYQQPLEFKKLIDDLTTATIAFLEAQINAGAEIIKVFDSHAGLLGEFGFDNFVIQPMQKIVAYFKANYPHIPIIGFPRKAGILYSKFIHETKVDCVALDHTLPLDWVRDNLQKNCIVQGNLENIYLTLDSKGSQSAIKTSVETIIMKLYKDSPGGFIFNLGHGCLPSSKIENIELVIKTIRELQR